MKKLSRKAFEPLDQEEKDLMESIQKDYRQIQIKAIEEGIPYQTLISSIVHKYLNGSLAPRL
jgi:predicted DNA binding CopG/RHH family protein